MMAASIQKHFLFIAQVLYQKSPFTNIARDDLVRLSLVTSERVQAPFKV